MKKIILLVALATLCFTVNAQTKKVSRLGTPEDSAFIVHLLNDIGDLYCQLGQKALCSPNWCDTLVSRGDWDSPTLYNKNAAVFIEKPKENKTCECTWFRDEHEHIFFHYQPSDMEITKDGVTFWYQISSRYIVKDRKITTNMDNAIVVLQQVKRRLEGLLNS